MLSELKLLGYVILGGYIIVWSLGTGLIFHYVGKIIESTGLL